jgi:hypothetical protein
MQLQLATQLPAPPCFPLTPLLKITAAFFRTSRIFKNTSSTGQGFDAKSKTRLQKLLLLPELHRA